MYTPPLANAGDGVNYWSTAFSLNLISKNP